MASAKSRVKDVMTPNPACCVPGTPLQDVAVMLLENDCGAIPVVESKDTGRPVGVVTDRDIALRAVASGKNAIELRAVDCMTTPCKTVSQDTSLEDCVAMMEGNKVRRIVVVDDSGAVCGIVSQADLALKADEEKVAEVVKTLSEPTKTASGRPSAA
jgi:CBS domain-containing protein